MGNDHGFLFQEADRQRRPSDQLDYDYPRSDLELAREEAAFVRRLDQVLPRLKLLGDTLDTARAEYESLVRQVFEFREESGEPSTPGLLMTFDEFCAFVQQHWRPDLDNTYRVHRTADEEKGRFKELDTEIARIPRLEPMGGYWSELSYFGEAVRILSAYSMLHVFGRDPANAGLEVMWQYGPIVESGYVDASAFQPLARRDQTVLVATEGSTDVHILRRALDLLRPDVADFFRFVDVDEKGHPFWGASSLVKFAEGLIRIDVQNKVLFLLDNDAEGRVAFDRLKSLDLPVNMRAAVLPDIEELRKFPARGPEGIAICDINGRAAAMECYLDLNLPGRPAANILWSNYKKEIDTWHGSLEHKETYMRWFLDQTPESIVASRYDMSKLSKVVDLLLAEAEILIAGII